MEQSESAPRSLRSGLSGSRLPLKIPQLLGLIVLLAFAPWVLLTGKSERDARRAIEAHDAFSLPEFPIKFSRTMKWDPLGFMGQGMRAGFWEWTPTAMNLADKGRAYFSESPGEITCIVGAGRREVSKIESHRDQAGRRDVRFRYRWTEITPPAAMLLSTPPQQGREYEGRAMLVKEAGRWRVESLEAPDFDRPMALLKDTTAGIRR